jgi:hypothetical protein
MIALETGIDATTLSEYQFTVPDVSPTSKIYFLQFTPNTGNATQVTWTTRFTVSLIYGKAVVMRMRCLIQPVPSRMIMIRSLLPMVRPLRPLSRLNLMVKLSLGESASWLEDLSAPSAELLANPVSTRCRPLRLVPRWPSPRPPLLLLPLPPQLSVLPVRRPVRPSSLLRAT